MTKVPVRIPAIGAALLAAAVLQGCAATAPPPAPAPTPAPAVVTPPPPPAPAPFVPTPGLSPRDRLQKIVALLNDGGREQARVEVVQLLQDAPADRVAQTLFDEIDKDPKLLLGAKSFPYKLQPGDSFASLAQRFLGDRYLFYALARYNGVDRPDGVEPGRTILIPGVPGRVSPRTSRTARPDGEEGDAKARKPSVPAPAPGPPSQPLRDPNRAAALRGQALRSLSAGEADRAVVLLRQAAALDPENAAIKRDLSRATRIQATLHR